LTEGLRGWLQDRHPEWSRARLEVTRPQPGLSSETLFVEVTHDSGSEALVVRLPPAGGGLFPDYDLERQARVQNALARTALPVPPADHEPNPDAIGTPFVVMPKVAGRTLETRPSYVTAGWLHASSPQDQARLLRSFLTTMGEVNRVPWRDGHLGELSGGGPDLAAALDWWERYLSWATEEAGWAAPYVEALAWCRAHLPADVPETSLLWGDPQLVNLVIAEDLTPAAVLDWEMASLGPAEVDLAWFLTLHEMSAERAGGDLPGFPDRAGMVAIYEAALGRAVGDLRWYEVFAHVRSGAIVVRAAQLMQEAGMDGSRMAGGPQVKHLARLTA
jgi:aminoglycoside phosphotransferase (APT) family kinase protein